MLFSLMLYPVCSHPSLPGEPKTPLSSAPLAQVWLPSVKERLKPGGQSHVREGEFNGTVRAMGEDHRRLLSSQRAQRNLSGFACYRAGRKTMVEGKESQISNGGGRPGCF